MSITFLKIDNTRHFGNLHLFYRHICCFDYNSAFVGFSSINALHSHLCSTRHHCQSLSFLRHDKHIPIGRLPYNRLVAGVRRSNHNLEIENISLCHLIDRLGDLYRFHMYERFLDCNDTLRILSSGSSYDRSRTFLQCFHITIGIYRCDILLKRLP